MHRHYKIIKSPVQGFTLLELIVVLFVVSFVAAVVLPSFTVSSSVVKAEARKVASLLRYLNETAVSRKETLAIMFDLDEGIVAWPEPAERTEKMKGLYAVELQSRGMVKEGELTVFFEPTGMREYLAVYLEHNGKEKVVMFNPVSGRAKIK